VHKPRVGISSCLLGEKVRYDGGHQFNRQINTYLLSVFDFISLCPEVGIGMSIPRPPIQLEQLGGEIHARGVNNKKLDVTAKLTAFSLQQSTLLQSLDGFIFKSRSPSCGTREVKLYSDGKISTTGTGIFARAIMQQYPDLPIVNEDDLTDAHACNTFIQRVATFQQARVV